MADQKITQLTAKTSALITDIIPIVEDPAGTPLTKKISKEDFGVPQSIKITSDYSTTVTTNVGITGLLFAITAGTYYRFKFTVIYQSAATTTGLAVSANIPAVTTFSAGVLLPNSGATSALRGYLTANNGLATGAGTPTTTGLYIVEVDGLILPSSSGNLQMQFASEINASTVTIKAGTNGLLWKI